ncbi:MAG: protease inhibitor I42 family protein [Candidatus Nanopelagicales bacterium]
MTLRTRLGAVLAVLVALATLATALPSPASAVPAKKPGPVIVRDLGVQVRLVPGERMKIILPTNRTTGYTWLAEGGCCTADDLPIARVGRGRYTAPSSDLAGAPGTTTWTVVALRPGPTTITVVTRPPGAQNTMQDETLGTVRLVVMRP